MARVRIRFLQDHVKKNSKAGTADETRYREGRAYDVSPGTANRYVKRGMAVQVEGADPLTVLVPSGSGGATSGSGKTGTANDPDPDSVKIPPDWEALPWPAKRSLAAKLSPDPIKDSEHANAAIRAELARRAPQAGSQTGPGTSSQ